MIKMFPPHALATILVLTAMTSAGVAVDTVWNFDGGLTADFGVSTMAYRGATASYTSFGTTANFDLPSLYGDEGTAQIMSFPATTASQGYTVTHNGASAVQDYTMIWDVLYPESSDVAWRSLLQTNQANTNDGDFFVGQYPWAGVGIEGKYHGVIKPDNWHRVAVTVHQDAANGVMTKYVDGGYVGQQPATSTRYSLDPTYHIFTDENGDTQSGYVSSYRFVDRVMTQEEIHALGGVHAAGTNTPGQVFADPSLFTPGSFTIAVLGDTQSYANNDTYSAYFNQMTQWLVDNKTSRNVQFVTHVGDIVDADTTTQWDRAMTAMQTLDGQIPYAVVPGNHDYSGSRSVSQFNSPNRFGPGSVYDGQSTLAGYYPAEPGSRMNTYHTFHVGEQDILVLALEFGPRDDVVAWAESVVDAHPDHRAILLTHAYMFDGGMWFDHSVDPEDPQGRTYDVIRDAEVNHVESIYNPHSYGFVASDTNDGRELWDKLVRERDSFAFVLTGHQFDERDGFPYLATLGDLGNEVYQMLFDTQARQLGGEGWIRLLEFAPDGTTVTVKTYSPLFDQWSHASDEFYTISLIGAVPGDANHDGKVDESDATMLAANWGEANATWAMGDFDGNRRIDAADASILAVNWGHGTVDGEWTAVPEPSGLTLLILGLVGIVSAAVLKRR